MSTNRFSAFSPEEKLILRVLLESHLNAVSEIACHTEKRVGCYLAMLEELEAEIREA